MATRNLMPWGLGRKSVPAKREEENPFTLMKKEIDAMFEDFFKEFGLTPFGTRIGAFSPRIDVKESDKEIKVSAELPGMDEKDIDVSITRDTLMISGEKKEEKEDKGKDYFRMERSYGSFSRSVPLPLEVEAGKADAKFRNGVLLITLPKTEKAIKEMKKIQVKTG